MVKVEDFSREVVGSNPVADTRWTVSEAITKKRNKGSQMGHTKRIFNTNS